MSALNKIGIFNSNEKVLTIDDIKKKRNAELEAKKAKVEVNPAE